MARKRRPTALTLEPIAAEKAREAAFKARWEASRRRAARILRDHGAPLFGVDVANPWCLAETQVHNAHRTRLETVAGLIEFGGSVPEADLVSLVSGAGPHGSDRMAAVWWDGLSWNRVLGDLGAPDGLGAQRLMMPLEDLTAAGVVRWEALAIICGATEDPNASRRADDRARLAQFLEELHRLAGEP